MTPLDVRWNVAAELDLLALPPSDGERVIDATERFARTGNGFVRVLLDGSGERRLYLPGFYVIYEVRDQTLFVLRVHALSP